MQKTHSEDESLSAAVYKEANGGWNPLQITTTFLELDERHKEEYITVINDDTDGRICWTCLCQGHAKTPYVWQGKNRMRAHVKGQIHEKFLDNPSAFIFNPLQIWSDNGLDPAMFALGGLNNSRGSCGYCENAEFPSTVDGLKKHMNSMKHIINVSKKEQHSSINGTSPAGATAATPIVYLIEEEEEEARALRDIDKSLSKRSCELIEEGRLDEKLIENISKQIENNVNCDKIILQKLQERLDMLASNGNKRIKKE